MSDPILYVEDGPDDVFFMQRAFKKINPEVELKIITDGEEAMHFFDGTKIASSTAPLSLIILDLNLPGRSGLEVLNQIRAKYTFPKVPVIVFSASSQQSDVDSSYQAGCNAYVVKPTDPERLRSLVAVISAFWLKENRYSKTADGVAIIAPLHL